jgi:hypothetical protein
MVIRHCASSYLAAMPLGGALGIHGSSSILTRGTTGLSPTRNGGITWTNFPQLYQVNNKFVQKTSVRHFHDCTVVECQGLSFLPWSIFGFIDCSINRISRPMSGPDGDYDGAPRRPLGDVAQRAVYTGYKKCYVMKVETVLLPNGISTLFGPTSARIHDVGGVLLMSGLDDFLVEIQQGKPEVHDTFGDSTYNAGYLQCIRSGFKSLISGVDITPAQKICNDRIKPCRHAIEWSYGNVENIFQICSNEKSYKIRKTLHIPSFSETHSPWTVCTFCVIPEQGKCVKIFLFVPRRSTK